MIITEYQRARTHKEKCFIWFRILEVQGMVLTSHWLHGDFMADSENMSMRDHRVSESKGRARLILLQHSTPEIQLRVT